MKFSNPLDYSESRNFRGKCDGMCGICPNNEFCAFSHAPKLRASGHKDSGNDKFNTRILDAFAFQTRYGRRNYASNQDGFSNSYKSGERNYSSGDYRKELGISDASGFHGEYSGGGG